MPGDPPTYEPQEIAIEERQNLNQPNSHLNNMPSYQLTVTNQPPITVDGSRRLYFLVTKALLETANVRLDELPNGCERFLIGRAVGDAPNRETLVALIEQRQDVPKDQRLTRTDPDRYSLYPADNLGVIISGENRYLLYNQDPERRLEELGELAQKNGITWNEISNNQQGENQENNNTAEIMKKSPNVILYGPPGTGKTYATVSVAAQLIDPNNSKTSWDALVNIATEENGVERQQKRTEFAKALGERVHFITFHQSYSYEDFIGGLRPVIPKKATGSSSETLSEKSSGNLQFDWTPGIFLRACAAAYKVAKDGIPGDRKSENEIKSNEEGADVEDFLTFCGKNELNAFNELEHNNLAVVLVIDEINRANMSRVFGELITLLEDDKRLGGKEQLIVSLPNRPDCKFGVPKNLIIIGTMNTADKSLALLDLALRRRFEFVRLDPQPGKIVDKRLGVFLTNLNRAIEKKRKSSDYGIGHAYFMTQDVKANMGDDAREKVLEGILQRKIVPLLQEYFGGDDSKVLEILSEDKVKLEANGDKIIKNPVTIASWDQLLQAV